MVDNVSGSIDIEAASGDTVELTLKQTFIASNAAEMARAREEVVLEVTENPGRLELVQGGPWRCEGRARKSGHGHRNSGNCCCDHDDRDYEVRFDWTLKVPKNLDLEVDNVNEGAIRITGTVGHLEVGHVNDDVTLVRVAGEVDAQTVNGELKVDFAALPAGDCRFGTVNGDIDLAFPKGLGAELSFATLNGEVFTDFPFELGKLPPTSERSKSGGRNHHGLGGKTAATIGGGGYRPRLRDGQRRHHDSRAFLTPALGREKMNTMHTMQTWRKHNVFGIPGGALVAVALVWSSFAAVARAERLVVPLSDPAKPAELEVSLVMGSIKVTGGTTKEVVIEASSRSEKEHEMQKIESQPAGREGDRQRPLGNAADPQHLHRTRGRRGQQPGIDLGAVLVAGGRSRDPGAGREHRPAVDGERRRHRGREHRRRGRGQ